ncbi:MAG: hypothetical protein ACREOB_07025 [Thermodesulfobacteriota bacterium]
MEEKWAMVVVSDDLAIVDVFGPFDSESDVLDFMSESQNNILEHGDGFLAEDQRLYVRKIHIVEREEV